MKFPTTYPVGTLVQIISAAEFDTLPKDNAGYARFPSNLLSSDIADYMSPRRRSLCGSIMQIARKFGASELLLLKPLRSLHRCRSLRRCQILLGRRSFHPQRISPLWHPGSRFPCFL